MSLETTTVTTRQCGN